MNKSLSLLMLLSVLAGVVHERAGATERKERKFRFYYGATISELPPSKEVRIWIPLATSGHEQDVELLAAQTPVPARETQERVQGNRLLYFAAQANAKGEIPLDVEYWVTRRELLSGQGAIVEHGEPGTELDSTALVPADGTLVRKLFGDAKPTGDTRKMAHSVYDAVDDLLRYDKPDGQPWGRGDALWACDSRYGNCTDFHSIFIGACRDLRIPSIFEIGFSVPGDRQGGEIAGYHCWAKFLLDGRWEGVDISEADKHPELKTYYFGNLTADRVTFSVGRDLHLEPPPAAGPVNFLVYPYVEVDGKPHTKFVKRFRFEDAE